MLYKWKIHTYQKPKTKPTEAKPSEEKCNGWKRDMTSEQNNGKRKGEWEQQQQHHRQHNINSDDDDELVERKTHLRSSTPNVEACFSYSRAAFWRLIFLLLFVYRRAHLYTRTHTHSNALFILIPFFHFYFILFSFVMILCTASWALLLCSQCALLLLLLPSAVCFFCCNVAAYSLEIYSLRE